MKDSSFDFIKEDILRKNLDISFCYILTLLPLSESKTYDTVVKSSFRKTIIIYTASIIEAVLLHILKNKVTEKELSAWVWELKNKKILYKVDSKKEIVAGDCIFVEKTTKFNKLNLSQINSTLRERKIISKKLNEDIDEVRTLRNKLHIGTHLSVEGLYKKADLEFVFSIAKEVKDLAMKLN